MIGPVFDAHSEEARNLKERRAVRDWYAAASAGAYVHVLNRLAHLLGDLPALHYMGMDTDFATATPAALDRNDPRIVVENKLAQQVAALTTQLLRQRSSSMAWHSASWPGKLALLAHSDRQLREQCLQDLHADWQAWKAAQESAKSSTFLRKVVQWSPFNTALLKDHVDLAFCQDRPSSQVHTLLAKYAEALWSGFGQTK
eukprot:5393548-Lingulodinium_polyedra.AAC.1